ncbi:MAG: AraC family transcriptional regulator [Leptolyngbyaceae cyanobacterium bins.349]|nr:AraC family transcriptional regulator [Leptolyngbyaceae cyanobacterium bins.349]
MASSNVFTLDYREETDISHPFQSVLSSREAGWDRMQLSCYQVPPDHTLPEHRTPHHLICINYSNSLLAGQLTVEGKPQKIEAVPCGIGIYPANILLQEFWSGEQTSFLDLYLEPTLLTQASAELCNQDSVELVPNLEYGLDPLIYQIAVALKTALEVDPAGSKLYADAMATALVARLISRYSSHQPIINPYPGGLTKQQLKQVTDYIHEYLERDLSLAELANLVQLSPYHFARLFKRSTGLSPHKYLLQCRIKRAKQLLLERELSLAEIACVVGFSSQGHLNYHFKRLVGVTPKAFVRQQ